MAFLSQKSKRGVHTSFYFTKFRRPWPCSEKTGVLLEMLFSVWSLKAQHKGLQWRLECWCKKFKKWKSRSFWSFQERWDFYCHLLLLSKKYKNTCSPPGQKLGQVQSFNQHFVTFCSKWSFADQHFEQIWGRQEDAWIFGNGSPIWSSAIFSGSENRP